MDKELNHEIINLGLIGKLFNFFEYKNANTIERGVYFIPFAQTI